MTYILHKNFWTSQFRNLWNISSLVTWIKHNQKSKVTWLRYFLQLVRVKQGHFQLWEEWRHIFKAHIDNINRVGADAHWKTTFWW